MKKDIVIDPEFVQKLKVLLEAERAGVMTARRLLAESRTEEERALMETILDGERESCRDLGRMILSLGSRGSGNIGDFADKVMALPNLKERMELLVKGQQWVVRKIEEVLAEEIPVETREGLTEVHRVHVENIDLCLRFLESEQWVAFSH